jgi:hypothetical protein
MEHCDLSEPQPGSRWRVGDIRHWTEALTHLAHGSKRCSVIGLIRVFGVAGGVLAIGGGIGGCGASGMVVARVGATPITAASVEHWTTVMAGGQTDRSPSRRRQALEYLISVDWLLGEASRQGLSISNAEVRQRLTSRERSAFPGGEAELRDFLKGAGETDSDRRLEGEMELASEKLSKRMTAHVPTPTEAQVAKYYDAHKQQFMIAETREVEITNRKHASEIQRLRAEVERKHDLAARSETWTLTRPAQSAERKVPAFERTLNDAIFGASQNALIGPVKQRVDYFLFRVKKIVPARYRPLSTVGAAIRQRLADGRRRADLAEFVRAWRTAWIARTSCRPGYVVQKCREYAGARTPEDTTALG